MGLKLEARTIRTNTDNGDFKNKELLSMASESTKDHLD